MKATTDKLMITRKQYMESSGELFSEYYGQFITESTMRFVEVSVGLKLLKKSKCEHFNDIIQHSNGGAGGWIWDHTPINLGLARQLGEVGERCYGSMATHTCIGKEAARRLLTQEGAA